MSAKVALVTGGTRGVGLGIAKELGAAGATVHLTGRHSSPAGEEGTVEGAAAVVDAAGGRGIGIRCDHRLDAEVASLFEQIESEQGRLDLLVNCAATIPPTPEEYAAAFQPFWEADPSVWDLWCDVGLRSHYVASAHAARMMVRRRRGLIVNVSSAAAGQYFLSVAYGVGKGALDRFTADAAVELREHRVAVISLWPGLVRTEKTRKFEQAGIADLREAESPEFAGRAVVALAGDADVIERSGGAYYVAALAREYGFTELDGAVPGLPTYGGLVTHEPSSDAERV